jgi:hypothetical protein
MSNETAQVGLHLDEGKSQVEAISPQALLELGRVLEYGARTKYQRFNWVLGIDYSRVLASAQRHLLKWYAGKDIDEESGLHALAHCWCDIMFLLHYSLVKKYQKFDDRPFKEEA